MQGAAKLPFSVSSDEISTAPCVPQDEGRPRSDGGRPRSRPSCLRAGASKFKATTFDDLASVFYPNGTTSRETHLPETRGASTHDVLPQREDLSLKAVIRPPGIRQKRSPWKVRPPDGPPAPLADHLERDGLVEETAPAFSEASFDGTRFQEDGGALGSSSSSVMPTTIDRFSEDLIMIPCRPQEGEGAHQVISGLRCKKSTRLSQALATAKQYEQYDADDDDASDWAMTRSGESWNELATMERVSSNASISSQSSVESLNPEQEELIICMKNLGMQVVLPGDYHDGIDVHLDVDAKGIMVAVPVPAPKRSFLLVKGLLEQRQDLPMIVMLLQSGRLTKTAYTQVATRFLQMGVGDVMVQPSNPAYIEVVLQVSLCQCRRKRALLDATLQREAGLLWQDAHKIFPNIPKMRDDVEEPGVGAKLGRHHQIVSVLHKGEKGKVFLAVDSRTQEPRALKCSSKASLRDCNDIRQIEKEHAVMKTLRHPNVIAILGEAHSSKHVMLLLQFGGSRSLFHVIRSKPEKRLLVEEARFLWSQILEGLAHCHAHDVTHRNLKPESVVISDDGATARLISFGNAERAMAPLRHPGSMPFVAPEVMLMDMSNFIATAADIWAMGIILLEMLVCVNFLPRMLGWSKLGIPDRRHAEQVMELFSLADHQRQLRDTLQPRLCEELLSDSAFSDLLLGVLSTIVPERWPVTKVKKSPWLRPNFQHACGRNA